MKAKASSFKVYYALLLILFISTLIAYIILTGNFGGKGPVYQAGILASTLAVSMLLFFGGTYVKL